VTLPLFPKQPKLFPEPLPHTCHARGCSKPVKPELLMCAAHWRLVPKVIQRAVWAAYRPGQCDDKQPSEEWHRAGMLGNKHHTFEDFEAVLRWLPKSE
jgi:hypothetical protein